MQADNRIVGCCATPCQAGDILSPQGVLFMSVEDNVRLARRWFQEVWNEGRMQTVYELLAEDGVATGQSEQGETLRGPKDFVPFVERIRGAFPDMKLTVEDAFGADDRVALR